MGNPQQVWCSDTEAVSVPWGCCISCVNPMCKSQKPSPYCVHSWHQALGHASAAICLMYAGNRWRYCRCRQIMGIKLGVATMLSCICHWRLVLSVCLVVLSTSAVMLCLQDLSAMQFRFKDKEKPRNYVCNLSGMLNVSGCVLCSRCLKPACRSGSSCLLICPANWA